MYEKKERWSYFFQLQNSSSHTCLCICTKVKSSVYFKKMDRPGKTLIFRPGPHSPCQDINWLYLAPRTHISHSAFFCFYVETCLWQQCMECQHLIYSLSQQNPQIFLFAPTQGCFVSVNRKLKHKYIFDYVELVFLIRKSINTTNIILRVDPAFSSSYCPVICETYKDVW